jgi:hypothetical protein
LAACSLGCLLAWLPARLAACSLGCLADGPLCSLLARQLVTRGYGFVPSADVMPSGSGRHGQLGLAARESADFHDREGFSTLWSSKVFVIMNLSLLCPD